MCSVAESIREAKCWVVLLKTCPELFVLFPRGQGLTSNLLERELRSCLGVPRLFDLRARRTVYSCPWCSMVGSSAYRDSGLESKV